MSVLKKSDIFIKEREIQELVNTQREFFFSGSTIPVEYRISALKKLKKAIIENESKILEAVKKDLGKSSTESFMCEVGLVLSEISYMIRNVHRFAKDKTDYTNLAQFASRSYVK